MRRGHRRLVLVCCGIGIAVFATAIAVSAIAPRPKYMLPSTPTAAAKNFCTALFYRDTKALSDVVLESTSVQYLVKNRQNVLCRTLNAIRDVKYTQLREGQRFVLGGREVYVPAGATDGNVAIVGVDCGHGQDILPLRVLRIEDVWRVDERPLMVAARTAAEAERP